MAGTHSLWSPSSAKRWRTCLGSVVMNDGAPNPPSIYSAEGTVYHGIAEQAFKEGKRCTDYVGQVREADGFKFVINEELAEFAQRYVDALRARSDAGAIVRLEVKADTSRVLCIPEQTGTIDGQVFDIANETVETHDLKMGAGVRVYARNLDGSPNDQTFIYGSTTLLEWLLLADWKFLKLVIHQPRIGPPQELTLPRAEVEQLIAELRADAEKSYEIWQRYREDAAGLEAHLTPSHEACRWCARAGSCKVRAQYILEMLT